MRGHSSFAVKGACFLLMSCGGAQSNVKDPAEDAGNSSDGAGGAVGTGGMSTGGSGGGGQGGRTSDAGVEKPAPDAGQPSGTYRAYIGTPATIHTYDFDAGTGVLTPKGMSPPGTGSTYFAWDSKHRALYAINSR